MVPSEAPSEVPSEAEQSVIVKFQTGVDLAGLQSLELSDADQVAILIATAQSMGVSAAYLQYAGIELKSESRRSLSNSFKVASLDATALIDASIPMSGTQFTSPEDLYEAVNSNLETAVANGDFSSQLQEAAIANDSPSMQDVEVTGSASSPAEVVVPSTKTPINRPTRSPTRMPSAAVGSCLRAGDSLLPGQCLKSPNYRYTLCLEGNGELTTNDIFTGTRLWSNGKNLDAPVRLELQLDGNMVEYGVLSQSWSSGTAGSDLFAAIQNDGNFVLYNAQLVPQWSCSVNEGCPIASPYNGPPVTMSDVCSNFPTVAPTMRPTPVPAPTPAPTMRKYLMFNSCNLESISEIGFTFQGQQVFPRPYLDGAGSNFATCFDGLESTECPNFCPNGNLRIDISSVAVDEMRISISNQRLYSLEGAALYLNNGITTTAIYVFSSRDGARLRFSVEDPNAPSVAPTFSPSRPTAAPSAKPTRVPSYSMRPTASPSLRMDSCLFAGDTLFPGRCLNSPNYRYTLCLGINGELTTRNDTSGAQLWTNGIIPVNAGSLDMQTDGDLVVKGDELALWSTGTSGVNLFTAIQNDGNFVVYNPQLVAQWTCSSAAGCPISQSATVATSLGELCGNRPSAAPTRRPTRASTSSTGKYLRFSLCTNRIAELNFYFQDVEVFPPHYFDAIRGQRDVDISNIFDGSMATEFSSYCDGYVTIDITSVQVDRMWLYFSPSRVPSPNTEELLFVANGRTVVIFSFENKGNSFQIPVYDALAPSVAPTVRPTFTAKPSQMPTLSPTKALQYLRFIQRTPSASGDCSVGLVDVRLFYQGAQLIPEGVSSSAVANCFDGLDTTECAAGPTCPAYLQIDLGDTAVDQIIVINNINAAPDRMINVELEYFNGGTTLQTYTFTEALRAYVIPISETASPTVRPTRSPTSLKPTFAPSVFPTKRPTAIPSIAPSKAPTVEPSRAPSKAPTLSPSSLLPSMKPTSLVPTLAPTRGPTVQPSIAGPSVKPSSAAPSRAPTRSPTAVPSTARPSSRAPSVSPTTLPPTLPPSKVPTVAPSAPPSKDPTISPSRAPTVEPSVAPSIVPTVSPSVVPSKSPTIAPTIVPTVAPSVSPSVSPTVTPTVSPTFRPSVAIQSCLYYGDILTPGQCIKSQNGRFTMCHTSDGEVATNDLSTGTELWNNHKHPNSLNKLEMQTNGNLVLWGSLFSYWSTGTSGSNFFAAIQNDGNFVVYNPQLVAQWTCSTAEGCPIFQPITVVTSLGDVCGPMLPTAAPTKAPVGPTRAPSRSPSRSPSRTPTLGARRLSAEVHLRGSKETVTGMCCPILCRRCANCLLVCP